jgi:hypothetical protein
VSANFAEELKVAKENLASVTETCDTQRQEIGLLKKKGWQRK